MGWVETLVTVFEQLASAKASGPKKRALVIDCETTGLSPERGDRIVSFAALELINDGPTGEATHLIFSPGCKCHPAATRVHGLSDHLLSHQEPFEKRAREIADWIGDALVIG